MKKSVLIVGIALILLLNVSLIIADNNTTITSPSSSATVVNDSKSQIDDAYDCLKDKIEDRGCNEISLEEKIFSVLSTGKCKSELSSASSSSNCWPSNGCTVKATAQAILALDKTGSSITSAKNWLISQNGTPEDLAWYLQIDSTNETTCRISYDGAGHSTTIKGDKRFTSGAGSCLSLEVGRDWWLKISSSCVNKKFEISCDGDFSTSLIFKKSDSSVFYISENTNSAPSEGTTSEKVDSLCFKQGGYCSYEGSLWATLVLKHLKEDVSSYLPYLVTMAEDNEQFIPESFLYALTGYPEFRSDLLQKQKNNKYWEETNGRKFYDTAVALLPLSYESPQEKLNTQAWLFEVQGKDGCWDGGNILSNAFILYSIWPRVVQGAPTSEDCEDSGKYCMLSIDCALGNVLPGYRCVGTSSVCCSVPKVLQSCTEQLGEICNSAENCAGGSILQASGLLSGQTCCGNGGYCQEPVAQSACALQYGTCESISCASGEEEDTTLSCGESGMVCCFEKKKSSGWLWWIIILLVLIILVVLAIIFREKLRPTWMRIKSKFSKGGASSNKPSSGQMATRPSPPMFGRGTMPQRRIFPSTGMRGPTPVRKPQEQPHDELNDVLKKLKEMGRDK